MARINIENLDEIGKKLGIQRKDLPRRKMNYFMYKILNFFFQFVIIVLLASMGLYIGDINQKSISSNPSSSFYPFSMSSRVIPWIPTIFLLGGLKSGNPEDSLQRSKLRLNRKKGFVIISLILSIVTLSIGISKETYSMVVLYSVYQKK
jgi:hypothetical protein